jgi:hypothetical protein
VCTIVGMNRPASLDDSIALAKAHDQAYDVQWLTKVIQCF